MIDLENISSRSQDIAEARQDAGQFYWEEKNGFTEKKYLIHIHQSYQ